VAELPAVEEELLQRRWDHHPRHSRDDPLLEIPPAVYVADLLGQAPGRDHKVPCPFHEDPRASLHAYPTGHRGWVLLFVSSRRDDL
jgi:hypothetical protein